MIPIAVTYNLASIAKMSYKDKDNNGIFVKVRGAHDEDDEGEETELSFGERLFLAIYSQIQELRMIALT